MAKLLKEQAHNEILFEQVSARSPLSPPKKKYQVVNERLKEIVRDYETYANGLFYLRAIAHSLWNYMIYF